MSVETARAHLKKFGLEARVQEFDVSSATVELAAKALGVAPARISKTLSFKTEDGCMLIVCAGDVRIDNKKYKERFSQKAKMLTPDEVSELVGHPVGGVCPFGIRENVPVYLDRSLLRFDTVYPAAGSASSAIGLTTDELYLCSGAGGWVDVCRVPCEEEAV
jgi:prolyl-tRNA editing enzyme YbaK/EbsC (Cys-tRNA(Pro) deacylase)